MIKKNDKKIKKALTLPDLSYSILRTDVDGYEGVIPHNNMRDIIVKTEVNSRCVISK